jgi:hypothetical protein
VRHALPRSLWQAGAVVVLAACAPDATPMRTASSASTRAGYATIHDTMPEAVHEAMHRAVERADEARLRGRGIRVQSAVITRIAGTKDAWVDFVLTREAGSPHDAVADTLAMLMNCNADSLHVQDAQGRIVGTDITVEPQSQRRFGPTSSERIRVFGLRGGRKSETLVRTSLGGDMVIVSQVAER